MYNIIYSIMNAAICVYFYNNLLQKKEEYHYRIKIAFVLFVVADTLALINFNNYESASGMFGSGIWYFSSFLAINIFFVWAVFEDSFSKKFFVVIINIFLFVSINRFIEIFMVYLLGELFEWRELSYRVQLIIISMGNVLIMLTQKIIISGTKIKEINSIRARVYMTSMILPVSTFVILSVIVDSEVIMKLSYQDSLIISMASIFLLVGNIAVFFMYDYYLKTSRENERYRISEMKNEMDRRYYERMEMENRMRSEFIHDVRGNFAAIAGLAKSGRNDEILDITSKMNISLENTSSYRYCRNNVINAVILDKKSICKENNIQDFSIFVEKSLYTEPIDNMDIIVILGNLLDNAIEASTKTDSPEISLRIFNKKKMLIIEVKNNFIGSIVKKGSIYLSTKSSSNHGIGLSNVQKAATKYDGIVDLDYEAGIFVASVILRVD